MPTVRNLLCLSCVWKMFVREVTRICPSSFIISFVIPCIPWALCFSFCMVLSTSYSAISEISSVSGLDFIVLSVVGTLWV